MNDKLEEFAKRVLRLLEHNDDWSADVLDAIADNAYSMGLADSDDEGYFRIAEDLVRCWKA